MRVSNWHPEQFDGEIVGASMERLRKAAYVVRDSARSKMVGFKHTWKEHGPYNSGKYAGKVWTARDYAALERTIRVVEKHGQEGFLAQAFRNVWVMAGNYKTWYAQQVEFGKAGWKGGPHAFLRPALNQNKDKIRSILENG